MESFFCKFFRGACLVDAAAGEAGKFFQELDGKNARSAPQSFRAMIKTYAIASV